MSTLNRLFSGYTGGGHTAKNGKFSTIKNNHNRNKYNRPTVMYGYSHKYLVLWFGENKLKAVMEDVKNAVEDRDTYNEATYIYNACKHTNRYTDLPSYLNPIYRRAYHEPKHRR